MLNKNQRLSILVCGLLAGCGGGGSSDKSTTSAENNAQPTQPTQPETISYSLSLASMEDRAIQAVEQSQIVLDLVEKTNSSQSVTYTYSTEPSSLVISASVRQQKLMIEIGQLENNEKTTLTITGEVEGKQSSEQIVLNIANRSADAVLEEIQIWQQRASVYQFDDVALIAPKYAQAAYFAGAVGRKEKQQLMADHNAAVVAAKATAAAVEQVNSLALAVLNYEASTLSESGLIDVLSVHKAAAQAQSDNILNTVNAIAELSPDIPILPISRYQYIPEYDVFSAMIGNPEMGAFQQGRWSFSNDFSFLNQLVPALGDLSTCETN